MTKESESLKILVDSDGYVVEFKDDIENKLVVDAQESIVDYYNDEKIKTKNEIN